MAESEQTVNLYQKKLANDRQAVIALQEELQQIKDDFSEIEHNTEVHNLTYQNIADCYLSEGRGQ